MRYIVQWEIDAEDMDSPEDAATYAWEALRREDSIACVFTVVNVANGERVEVDLWQHTTRAQVQAEIASGRIRELRYVDHCDECGQPVSSFGVSAEHAKSCSLHISAVE